MISTGHAVVWYGGTSSLVGPGRKKFIVDATDRSRLRDFSLARAYVIGSHECHSRQSKLTKDRSNLFGRENQWRRRGGTTFAPAFLFCSVLHLRPPTQHKAPWRSTILVLFLWKSSIDRNVQGCPWFLQIAYCVAPNTHTSVWEGVA